MLFPLYPKGRGSVRNSIGSALFVLSLALNGEWRRRLASNVSSRHPGETGSRCSVDGHALNHRLSPFELMNMHMYLLPQSVGVFCEESSRLLFCLTRVAADASRSFQANSISQLEKQVS